MLVSVIIPCYNVEDYVEACVDSVLAQTHQELEIILVDNNSSDRTFSKLKKIEEAHPSKIIVATEKKKGAPAARNKGLHLSKGKWIQFLDADDLLLPQKLEHQLNQVTDQHSFLVAKYTHRSVDGQEVEKTPISNPFFGVFQAEFGITSANLWNRTNLIEIGGWDETLTSSQETTLMFELLKNNQNVCFDTALSGTIIRERPSGQISQSDPTRKWKNFLHLRVRMFQFLEKEMPDYYRENEKGLKQALFEKLRIYAKFDLDAAVEIHKQFLSDFQPHPSQVVTSNYLRLYRIFGFKYAERIKKILR